MKSFHETYDLNDGDVLDYLIDKVSEAHAAAQNLEAGAKPTKLQQAEATFLFLSVLGFYPTTINVNGVERPIAGQSLVSDAADENFYIVFKFADSGTESRPVSMFGSMMQDTKEVTMPEAIVAYLADLSFPGIVIQKTKGVSKDGAELFHITARPEFMQPKSYKGFPVESGSAICSDSSVAVMQAVLRMIAMHLVGQQWANQIEANLELENEVECMSDCLLEYAEADKAAKIAKLRDEFETTVASQKDAYMAEHGSNPLAEMAWELMAASTRYKIFGVVK